MRRLVRVGLARLSSCSPASSINEWAVASVGCGRQNYRPNNHKNIQKMQESVYDDMTVSMLGQGNDPWGSSTTPEPQNLWKPNAETPPLSIPQQTSFEPTRPMEIEATIPQDQIRVSIAPEKGGVVFKHVNYIVQSQLRRSSSVRRFSDFDWLHDTLYKRYSTRLGKFLRQRLNEESPTCRPRRFLHSQTTHLSNNVGEDSFVSSITLETIQYFVKTQTLSHF